MKPWPRSPDYVFMFNKFFATNCRLQEKLQYATCGGKFVKQRIFSK